MDEATTALLLRRREIAKQMLSVEPGTPEMEALLEQESAVVDEIRRTGIDLSDPSTAYGIAYGVLSNGNN